ncbi:MAG: sigma-70 family RNA polymerase sigma factor [Planctomycetes bacterium]|nr:sigma-70 family RNA polymerase sigma factor [Planctomycetota bacterium]OQC19314.1 MAG: ECF RNA polymerase sigma factor SigR [Planctomycetes bacterium ADurb.Bin069]NMD35125.1 sigma-70 family RNA polymerase sigma factor [Planctomycetota bacterium]HNU26969.1 sigma-70 family RNA polymerase sigma factor [Planctomycetota bacterium]HQJ54941.1 sigma-70 family RNA polymerase sigma factor [Planctomycetota bacterium]
MPDDSPGDSGKLERFRSYLQFLADEQVNLRFRRKFDPFDVVQDTLLKAHRSLDRFRGKTDVQIAAWLRKILTRSLYNAVRDHQCARRDLRREKSIEELLARSSATLETFSNLARFSPSSLAAKNERLLNVADAFAVLPDDQRRALTMKYAHGLSLAQIAKGMNRSVPSVAGLLRRGLHTLRARLKSER